MKKDAEVKIVTGGRGSGKTTWMSEYLKGKNRVLVLDPMDDINLSGYTKLSTTLGVYQHIKKNWNKGFKIIFTTGHRDEHCQNIMNELCRGLFMIMQPYKDGNKDMIGKEITFAIDEAHKFIPNPPNGDLKGRLQDMISLGRHYGIEMICATQRIVKLWTEARGNAMHHYFFRQGDHNDIDTISAMIGRENKINLLELETHEYLHLDKTKGLHVLKGRNIANFKQ